MSKRGSESGRAGRSREGKEKAGRHGRGIVLELKMSAKAAEKTMRKRGGTGR
jgi:hypothetical protein